MRLGSFKEWEVKLTLQRGEANWQRKGAATELPGADASGQPHSLGLRVLCFRGMTVQCEPWESTGPDSQKRAFLLFCWQERHCLRLFRKWRWQVMPSSGDQFLDKNPHEWASYMPCPMELSAVMEILSMLSHKVATSHLQPYHTGTVWAEMP